MCTVGPPEGFDSSGGAVLTRQLLVQHKTGMRVDVPSREENPEPKSGARLGKGNGRGTQEVSYR